MISPLGRVLRDLRSAFEELGASWYVFGAQAAIAYGVVRSTGDIDVTVDSAERPTAAIADALVARGFSLKFADREFVEKTRVLPILHPKGVPVDVVFAGPGFDAVFFSRVVRRKLGGVIVPVAAAEDIIVMKVLAGREKDISDVKGMLAANRKIRVEQVRTVLAELETLLDQSDLQPAFEAALSAARR